MKISTFLLTLMVVCFHRHLLATIPARSGPLARAPRKVNFLKFSLIAPAAGGLERGNFAVDDKPPAEGQWLRAKQV